MSSKRSLKSDGTVAGIAKKRTRKTKSLERKLEVIKRYEEGQTTGMISRALNICESNLQHIRDNAEKYKMSIKASTPVSAQNSPYCRPAIMENMETMLATWIHEQCRCQKIVSPAAICAKARSIYDDLKGNDSAIKTFTASNTWFYTFKARHGFKDVRFTNGPITPAALEAAKTFPKQLMDIIKDGGYTAKQVFNVVDIELYWKEMPESTCISTEEKSACDSKDCLSILLGGNAEGDFKLKPLVVQRNTDNPWALDYPKTSLPIYLCKNKKGGMTESIFKYYLTTQLSAELKRYCMQQGLPFRVLLVLDNGPNRPLSLQEVSNDIKIVFLPPRTISLLQPMAQGVIKTFKSYYIRSALNALLDATSSGRTVKEFWNSFDIKNALDRVIISWELVPTQCMNSAWKEICPQFYGALTDFNIEDNITTTNKESVAMLQKLGLGEVDENRIEKLLQPHTQILHEELVESNKTSCKLSDKPQPPVRELTEKRLTQAFEHISAAIAIFEEDDPNKERSSVVAQQMMGCLFAYQKILNEKKKANS